MNDIEGMLENICESAGDRHENQTLSDSQKAFLKKLIGASGLVSLACKQDLGMQFMHRQWLEKNSLYRAVVEMITEQLKDIAEYKLFQLVQEGDFNALKFVLTAKAVDRGYGGTGSTSVIINQQNNTMVIKKPSWFQEIELPEAKMVTGNNREVEENEDKE